MGSVVAATLREELRYDPDRARRALQVTLSVVLVVLVMVAAQMPFVGIAPYLVFLLSQDETLSTRAAIVMGSVVTLMSCVAIVVIAWVAFDHAWLRIPLFVAVFYGGFYLMRTFSQPKAVLGALVILGLVMVGFDRVPTPTYLFTQLAWLIAALGVVIAGSLLGGWLTGIPTGRARLRQVLRARMTATERSLRQPTLPPPGASFAPLPGERHKAQETLERAILVGRLTERQGDHYSTVEQLWTDLDEACDSFGAELEPRDRVALADALSALRHAILQERPLAPREQEAIEALRDTELPDALRTSTRRIERAWSRILSEEPGESAPEESSGMLPNDFGTNPLYAAFALRATIATMGCYLLMVSTHWDGVHTCMVTTVATALATTGAQIQKQALRISGAIAGGIVGIVMVTTVLAHDDSLFTLLTVIACGTLMAAWVSLGSTRVAYGGWQFALAFFMTVLQGPHPATDLAVIGDRWIGILLGIVAMQAAFRFGWPETTAQAIRSQLHAVRAMLDEIDRRGVGTSADQSIPAREISTALTQAADAIEEAAFETRFRPSGREELVATRREFDEARSRFAAVLG